MPDVLKATNLTSRRHERERTSARSPQHGETLPEVEPSATPPTLRPHPVWMRQLLDSFAQQRRVSICAPWPVAQFGPRNIAPRSSSLRAVRWFCRFCAQVRSPQRPTRGCRDRQIPPAGRTYVGPDDPRHQHRCNLRSRTCDSASCRAFVCRCQRTVLPALKAVRL